MKITIIGGGFGGLRTALKLSKDKRNEIVLITDRPTFQYYPSIYSSATGHSHQETWAPLGQIFADKHNVTVYIDSIVKLNTKTKELTGESGTVYGYDTLVMSIGVVTTYFGIDGLESYSHGIKSEQEVNKLKQRLFVDIAENRQIDHNYVVIGAGPTGVELSAALGSYIKRLCKHYKVKHHRLRIRLIEAAPRVLPRSSNAVSRVVENRLKKLNVSVEVGKKVESQNAKELIVSGQPIASHTVIWTSGVSNHPFFSAHQDIFKLSKNGRVLVNEYMEASPGVYVIGDNAFTPYSGLAQTAIYDANFVSKNFIRKLNGKNLKKYRPRLPVSAVPVGSYWAVIEWRWVKIYGFVGSLIRRMADIIGYSEILSLRSGIKAWHSANVYEDDYFTPTKIKK